MQKRLSKKYRLFSTKDLWLLFIPLIIEQLLGYLIGMIDSMMVGYVGEAAVSGVFLVDTAMTLLISIFTALATGGAIIAGQYLGNKEDERARDSANQLVWFIGILSMAVMIVMYLSKSLILNGLFGAISQEVKSLSNIYFMIVVASVPFIALYNAGAAIFRTLGNSKLPMQIMLAMNILNVIGDAVLVFKFDMGVIGVAIPTVISRVLAAIIIIILAMNKKHTLSISKTIHYKPDFKIIKQICSIGVPYGVENGLFQLGRLLIISLVSTFGTASIAANAIGYTLATIQVMPGMAINMGMTVVISRCIGAKDFTQAKYFTKKIIKIIYIALAITALTVVLLLPIILKAYNVSYEALSMIKHITYLHAILMVIFWPLAYALPVTFRASGNANFPMIISTTCMFVCRIGFAYVFASVLGLGMVGTWYAMFMDWIIRASIFTYYYIREKWINSSVIAE